MQAYLRRGAIGDALRHGRGLFRDLFPPTLLINIVGSLAMGLRIG